MAPDGHGAHRRGRRGHRQGDGAPPRRRRLRRRSWVGERRARPRPSPLREARRLRARPDAARSRRLEADRDDPRRGDRHADRRRLRTRHGARPRACARDRGRRLPRQAVLDEGARRARARGDAARRPPRGCAARRADRDRGAAHRPARGAGVRGRSEREADPDRVPAPLPACARAGRVSTRDELLQKLWGRRESHRDRTVDVFVRRLREKIDRRASRPHLHPDALRRRLQARGRTEELSSSISTGWRPVSTWRRPPSS